jgi:hypothetical protein
MVGKLITLPLRVWLGSARLLTRAAGSAAERAVSLAGQTLGVTSSNGSSSDQAFARAEPGWREESIEQPVSREESIEQPVSREEPVEHPVSREESIEQPVSREESIEHPVSREDSIEQPVSPVDVEHPQDEPARRPAPAQPRGTAPPRPQSVSAVRPPREEPDAPAVPEPVHVSEEPELVREEAEPGAEDGAGARVTVLEPWDGYAHMNAREVIDRARQASPAELAAVRLYESRHRSRQTVLAAVDRQLKLSSGSRPA